MVCLSCARVILCRPNAPVFLCPSCVSEEANTPYQKMRLAMRKLAPFLRGDPAPAPDIPQDAPLGVYELEPSRRKRPPKLCRRRYGGS